LRRFGDDILLGGDSEAQHFPILLDSGSSCIVRRPKARDKTDFAF
jgi:hypothetical protein